MSQSLVPASNFNGSTPTLKQFNPHAVPYQFRVIKTVRRDWDYKAGALEVLLSGSVGSAKSILLAHLLVTHCLMFPRARALMGRRSLPDLKDTLLTKVIEHIGDDLRDKVDFVYNKAMHKFTFSNGSELISRSWADGNYKKFRSLELSAIGIEELTENRLIHKTFYDEAFERLNRLAHVPENWMISATNPDSPRHWAYDHFIGNPKPNRKVFYSVTSDNKFLAPSYIETLKQNLDPKMARRKIYGEWVDIDEERVYYNYDPARNFLPTTKYVFNYSHPVDLFFDFNIGDGKPMSAGIGQRIGETFHVARAFVVMGARTADICDEIYESGLLDEARTVRIFGDATGKSKNTRSIKSDYDIIEKFLANYQRSPTSSLQKLPLKIEMQVPAANPPLRERHNIQNAQFLDANKKNRFYIYCDAKELDQGFRMTALKKGGHYIEDDSEPSQHLTTAVSYWVDFLLLRYREAKPTYRFM